MPFFLHQNITESSETTMQMCICKTMIKIYCINFTIFNFVFRRTWDQQEALFGIFPQKTEPQHRSQWAFRNECSPQPSLTVFLLSWWYPLTSFKAVPFSPLLSAEVTGIVQAIRSKQLMLRKMSVKQKCICFLWRKCLSFIEQQRLNLVMNTLHLRLTVFILYFYKFPMLAVFIQGVQTPETPHPPDPPHFLVLLRNDFFTYGDSSQ